ncbi:MAG: asparagine--tRNA ligase [Spirochaetes bacterium RBG_13_68_11]|nr:MAG: asparagine--tRNA ligase [Spirochaetes bacterium RBG_13_68_11]
MERVLIADIGSHVDKDVEIHGWLYNLRSKGKLAFLQLRDGSGRIQGVAEENAVGPACAEAIRTLKMEASVKVRGRVRRDERAPTGFELTVAAIDVVQNPDLDYPIAKKEHGIDFLLENRHLWLRSSRPHAMMRIRNTAIMAFRRFFHDEGFLLIDTPILTGSIGESAGTLFEVPYFDLGTAYLAQTGQLYLEAACAAYGRVYNFGPTFRAEKSKTRRHLTEFWMLEAEVAYADNEDNMRLQERMVSAVVTAVLAGHRDDLAVLERDAAPLEKVTVPFDRLDYGEAVKQLQAKGSAIQWGDDLGGEDETILTKMHERPVFVTNYPKKAKAFYMKENPANPETVLCSDLLAPEGYGEIIGGSQREDVLEKLLARIREEKLPEESYGWYLDLRKFGSVPHSGYGIGLERTLAWICGVQHIRECIPFPRTISRIYP